MFFVVQTVRLSALHVFLILAVVIYLLFGAYVFHRLEGDNELLLRNEQVIQRKIEVKKLRNMTQEFVKFALYAKGPKETWDLVGKLAQLLYDSFHAKSSLDISAQEIVAVHFHYMEHEIPHDDPLNWSFSSSLLFSFTAITTIGNLKKDCVTRNTVLDLLKIVNFVNFKKSDELSFKTVLFFY